MKRIALLFLASCYFLFGHAQISITSGSLLYMQNFDALDTAVYNATTNPGSTNLPTGWWIYEYGTSTTRVNNGYVADSGASNTGDTYSYGTKGSLERALGSISSTSLKSSYGAMFVNNTGAAISAFTLRYRGEQWRTGATGRNDSLIFYYSTTASSPSDTAAAKWTMESSLLFTTPDTTASVGKLDGNDAQNSKTMMATVNTAIANGDTLYIRWVDRDVVSGDDGLAIDSVMILFSTNAAPHPNIVLLTPANNATNVSPSTTLSIVFDKQVTRGTGNIYVKNRNTQVTKTIAVSSSDVTIAGGYLVTISNLNLQSNATYHVMFDSTCFDTAGYRSSGIYDSTSWKFTTNNTAVGNINAATLDVHVVNPAANGNITILCSMPHTAALTARVYDLNGREVAAQSFNATKGENRMPMHTSLPAGSYIIRMDDGKEWGSAKVTMQ